MSGATAAYLARLEVWGLGLALVQGVAILLSWQAWSRATEGAAPSLRHRLACGHFAALAVLPILSLVVLHWSVTRMGEPAFLQASGRGQPLAAIYGLTIDMAGPTALVWAAGTVIMVAALVRQAFDLRQTARGASPDAVSAAVERLAMGWLGKQPVRARLAEVSVPQVIGLRQPLLLTPRGLAAALAPAQLDAVLLHELAHVRRADFGWNLVQRLLLTLMWCNPAAWLLYGAISREREHCCDELAVAHGASPGALAQALVRLAEARAPSGLAMGLGGGQRQLTQRVDRLLRLERRPVRSGRLAAAVALSALCLAAAGAGRLGLADPELGDLGRASLLGPALSVDAHDGAGSFRLRIRQGRVLAATVGRSSLPPARIFQRGQRVVLVDQHRRAMLALTVTPAGSIRWEGRS